MCRGRAQRGRTLRVKRACRLSSLLLGWVLASVTGLSLPFADKGLASPLVWQVDRAMLVGTGCQRDVDAFVLANGADLSLVFSNLGMSLGSAGGGALSGVKTCNIRVPASVPEGSFVGRLDQSLLYGVIKSAGSEGSVRARGRLFGLPFRLHELDFRRGEALFDPQRVKSRRDVFRRDRRDFWANQWCKRGRLPRGELRLHLRVQAAADSGAEEMVLFVDGMDFRYEILTEVSPCPA